MTHHSSLTRPLAFENAPSKMPLRPASLPDQTTTTHHHVAPTDSIQGGELGGRAKGQLSNKLPSESRHTRLAFCPICCMLLTVWRHEWCGVMMNARASRRRALIGFGEDRRLGRPGIWSPQSSADHSKKNGVHFPWDQNPTHRTARGTCS